MTASAEGAGPPLTPPPGLSSSGWETQELSDAEHGGSILTARKEKWQRCRANGTGRFLHKGQLAGALHRGGEEEVEGGRGLFLPAAE